MVRITTVTSIHLLLTIIFIKNSERGFAYSKELESFIKKHIPVQHPSTITRTLREADKEGLLIYKSIKLVKEEFLNKKSIETDLLIEISKRHGNEMVIFLTSSTKSFIKKASEDVNILNKLIKDAAL
jgi:hypothetical protein